MSTGVMIAFLPTPTNWYKGQDFAHLTLIYAGDIMSMPMSSFNELAKDAITVAKMMPPFSLDVLGVDVMGEGDKVDVLTLKSTPELLRARDLVEHWNGSQYTNFIPHVTVGPEGSAEGMLPVKLYFDQLMVAWGNRQLLFPVGMNYLSEAKNADRY
jgi:2'-5' RNA ligase